jgi:hypothetical protein
MGRRVHSLRSTNLLKFRFRQNDDKVTTHLFGKLETVGRGFAQYVLSLIKEVRTYFNVPYFSMRQRYDVNKIERFRNEMHSNYELE